MSLDCFGELLRVERPQPIVAIKKPHGERRRNIHLPPETSKRLFENVRRIRTNAKCRMVTGKSKKFLKERFEFSLIRSNRAKFTPKCKINLIRLFLLTCLSMQCNEVPNKRIEGIFRTTK